MRIASRFKGLSINAHLFYLVPGVQEERRWKVKDTADISSDFARQLKVDLAAMTAERDALLSAIRAYTRDTNYKNAAEHRLIEIARKGGTQ